MFKQVYQKQGRLLSAPLFMINYNIYLGCITLYILQWRARIFQREKAKKEKVIAKPFSGYIAFT